MTRRSPIRLLPDASMSRVLKRKVYAWRCDDAAVNGAMFTSRTNKDEYAILHRSTKQSGKWQVSFFDKHGPVSDAQATSCERALRDHLPARRFRLRSVETRSKR